MSLIRQAVPPIHTPPGLTIITYVSIEVLQ